MKTELNDCQKRFWLEGLLHPDDSNNIAVVFSGKRGFKVEVFRAALLAVVAKTEALHSVYRSEAGSVFMETVPADSLIIVEQRAGDEQEAMRIEDKFGRRLFRLAEELPLRVLIMRLPGEVYHLELVYHHICMDAVSNFDLFGMIVEAYRAILNGKDIPSRKIPAFAEYLEYEERTNALNKQGLEYWQRFFETYPTGVVFPFVLPARVMPDLEHCFQLGKSLNYAVGKLARQLQTTPFLILNAAWQWVLAGYTGNNRVTISYAVNLRPACMRGLVGPFVNNLPCGVDLEGNPVFSETVGELTAQRRESRSFQRVIMTDMVDGLRSCRRIGREEPFLNVAINYVEWGHSQPLLLKGARLDFVRRVTMRQYFDLTLEIEPAGGGCCRMIHHDAFPESYIHSIHSAFIRLLKEVVVNPGLHFSGFDLLSGSEMFRVKRLSDHVPPRLPHYKDFITLFRRSARLHAARIAVMCGNGKISYKRLEAVSDRIAWAIRREYRTLTGNEMVAGTPVGICLGRDLRFVASVLGVIKAGGAYVPLDPEYPPGRLSFMAGDCGMKLMLVSQQYPSVVGGNLKLIYVEKAMRELYPEVLPGVSPENTAYVIYTSGTTGQPKGVPVTHGNLCFFIQNSLRWLKIRLKTVQLESASFSFDASVMDLFPALVKGATVCIAREGERKDPARLAALIRRRGVNMAYIAPVMLAQIRTKLSGLETVYVGGDTTPADVVSHWMKGRRFLNFYGPTENTVFSTGICCLPGIPAHNIGKPIKGVAAYVVDEYGRLVPDGVPGELYLGGLQLSPGYCNRKELNEKKFIPNPFQWKWEAEVGVNACLYKTGDRVRRLQNGELLFLGRIDRQVKVRGFRIEPEEIENSLNDFTGIQNSVVAVKENGNEKQLVAYLQGDVPNEGCLRDYLARCLPAYMIPVLFVKVAQFALTPNGKIDRNRLPEPEWREKTYVAPTTPAESRLARLAADLLGMEQVGVEDDLFALGLTSLNSMNFADEALKAGLPVSMSALYIGRTIRKVAGEKKPDVCRWFKAGKRSRPVIVLVCGHLDFGELLYSLAQGISKHFEVLIVESYHNYPELIGGLDWQGMLGLYKGKLEKMLEGRRDVYAFMGHCFGGELAYALAVEWEKRQERTPEVWLFNALACRRDLPDLNDAGMSELKTKEDYPEFVTKRQRIEKMVATETLSVFNGNVVLFIPRQFTKKLLSPGLPDVSVSGMIERVQEVYARNPEEWGKLVAHLKVMPLEGTHWTMLSAENVQRIVTYVTTGYAEENNIEK